MSVIAVFSEATLFQCVLIGSDSLFVQSFLKLL